MTIVFFWTGVTGYMADCWRALQRLPSINIKIYIEENCRAETNYDANYVLRDLDCRLVFNHEPLDLASLRREIAGLQPDLFAIVGWRARLCRFAAEERTFASIPKLCIFDLPFAFTFRKLLAPFVLNRYLKRFTKAFVPGERAAFYARFLGFRSEQIERGLFSIDIKQYAASFEQRKTLPAYPQRFLYVGRYAKEKRLDVLIKAYQIYRKQVRVPWALDCVGMGTAMTCLANVEGVRDLGFVQPQAMAEIYATHGAFVLASDFDPWPLVIAEAAASGLPVVCTDACGSHVDLVRSYYNGVVCGTASPVSLANGMMWIHENASDLLSIGGRGMDLVKPYSSEMWAVRVATLAKNCT